MTSGTSSSSRVGYGSAAVASTTWLRSGGRCASSPRRLPGGGGSARPAAASSRSRAAGAGRHPIQVRIVGRGSRHRPACAGRSRPARPAPDSIPGWLPASSRDTRRSRGSGAPSVRRSARLAPRSTESRCGAVRIVVLAEAVIPGGRRRPGRKGGAGHGRSGGRRGPGRAGGAERDQHLEQPLAEWTSTICSRPIGSISSTSPVASPWPPRA